MSVEQVKLTFNENYILFLAGLLEHHLNETKQLVEFAQSLAPTNAVAAEAAAQDPPVAPLSESTVRSLAA